MIKKVKNWLNNPKRDYAEGVELFDRLANKDFKTKYAVFFKLKEGETEVKQFEIRFTMLVNKMSAIYSKMQLNPEQYLPKPAPAWQVDSVSIQEEIIEKSKKIKALEQEKEDLEGSIMELEESDEEKQDEIDDLNAEIEEKDEEIRSLKTELEETAKKNGLKVVKYENLPEEIKKKFDRTKEIVPLIAKIHAEIQTETLSDDDRKKLAGELCALDDERRNIWDIIDAWAEGKDVVLDEPKEQTYSDDPLIRGVQISKRIDRLKDNISKTKSAIEKHIASKKKNLEAKAGERLIAYEKELEELNGLTAK
jgi:SMC interacting uncharacterized protein involved in chromosome segregation